MKREDMWLYGIPRVGGKGLKAERIVEMLPEGKRLVDLFGGGGSISMQATLSGKYEQVIYNDLDTSLVTLFKMLLSGDEIDFKKYVLPKRDKFFYYRDEMPKNDLDRSIILVCWSFSMNRKDFIWGKEKEKFYQTISRAMFYGDTGTKYDALFKRCKDKNIEQSNLEFQKFAWEDGNEELLYPSKTRKTPVRKQLRQLEKLKRLESINDNAFKLDKIKCYSLDYRKLKIHQDDVVFLDPPYINCSNMYEKDFDYEAFIDFYTNLPNKDVYITEYTQLPNTEVIEILPGQKRFCAGAKKRDELLLKVIK